MNQILDMMRPWLKQLPGDGELEQLWFAVIVMGSLFAIFLLWSVVKGTLYFIRRPKQRREKIALEKQHQTMLQAVTQLSNTPEKTVPNVNVIAPKPHIAKVQIFIDYANFDKNWVENAYGVLAEGNQKVRLDWNKVTDIVLREVKEAMSGWQPDLVYAGTFVQASVLPERFTTPRTYKLPKSLAANYYIYAKDAELVKSRIDGKEYIAKKLHPTHVFLRYMLRKLPGYHVNISRRVIERNQDGTPVIMTSKSGVQYIKSGEKAVDSKVIADMTAGAMSDGYDIAVLLGSDTDFLPVVETIQKGYNKPVIHVGFERGGHQVREACWSHVVLNKKLVQELREPPRVISRPVPTKVAQEKVTTTKNAVSAVAAKLADPVIQEPVKQVVQLFTPESLKERQTQPVNPFLVKPEKPPAAVDVTKNGVALEPDNIPPKAKTPTPEPAKVEA